jgi:adsorption protein B
VGRSGGLILVTIFFILGAIFLVGSLDDLMIDLAHLLGGLRPREISKDTWREWKSKKEKPIALMIPAWKESDVLEAMVRTNLTRIRYSNFKWFIGVYPNDQETLEIAKRLEQTYPSKITVVVTDRPGPTSKGHCLNCIMNVIEESAGLARRTGVGWVPHYIAIHDAEDVIHPYSLTAINAQPENLDFIQVPIFSLPVPVTSWVAGTYLDEFAEIHLKEIPVRQLLKMPIPSAGVGTFFSARILSILGQRFGYCFDEANLTEDYEISQRIARVGGNQSFLLIHDEKGEIVATREYFPDSIGRSIRQKTRWTTGIGLQTLNKWGRFGNHLERTYWLRDLAAIYALYRDRKALWANPAAFLGWCLLCFGILFNISSLSDNRVDENSNVFLLKVLFIANAVLFTLRMFQRVRFTKKVYGTAHGLLSVPRVIPSNIINGLASISAVKNYFFAQRKGNDGRLVWAKTDHKFPDLSELSGVEEREAQEAVQY